MANIESPAQNVEWFGAGTVPWPGEIKSQEGEEGTRRY